MPLDRGVVGDAVERRIHGPARQAVHHRDFLEGGEPGAEAFAVLAAILRARAGAAAKKAAIATNAKALNVSPQITLPSSAKARDSAIAPLTFREYA